MLDVETKVEKINNVMFFSWVEKKDLLNDIHFKIKK